MREKYEKTLLPQCIAIGIGVEDFWHMTMRKLNPFLIADNIKRERENFNAWLTGYYTYIGVNTALAGAFGNKRARYIEQPLRITPLTDEEKVIKAKQERDKAIAFFEAMEKSFKTKEEQDGRN